MHYTTNTLKNQDLLVWALGYIIKTMLTDTHCHLIDSYVPPCEVPNIITRAKDANVGRIIVSSADPADPEKVIALAEAYNEVYATVGIHPEFAGRTDTAKIQKYLSHPKVVGVGEVGLDYHYEGFDRNAQIELFMRQLELARAANLPTAIHSRDAWEDTFDILKDVRGVMHCFTGSYESAKIMLDRGFFISASGIITFKNGNRLREVFAKIPLDRIVIETDAPYCTPVPYRGKQNEPAYVTEVAKVLASVKNIPMPELETILEKNVLELYPRTRS